MNYELLVYGGALGGALLFQAHSTAPFMAITAGNFFNQPGAAPAVVKEVHHEILAPPGAAPTHRIAVVV